MLAEEKREFDKVKYALEEVKQKGYGIVTPAIEEMRIEKPVLVRHGAKYAVKIKTTAPSVNLIKADIETELSPMADYEEEALDYINYIKNRMEEEPEKVRQINILGRSMQEVVRDGLKKKLYHMPEDAQMKFQDTLQRIINEGSGGLICIIL
ncbi:MAG: stage IV sporulation protein A [Defluviitaleaceae bacterium]|nr:stage IV sporulation protein A [Defluviitaleaceae bacterium]